MNLLPNNAKLTDQNFALLIDAKSTVGFKDLNINPLDCDASLLEHIALIKGANIENMLEGEIRQYLSTFTKKAIGTVGAVEDAISSILDNVELIEWYQDRERLPVGFFGVTVQVQNNIKYDERLFSISKKVINENKNVRSKLDGILLKLSKGLEVEVAGGATLWAKLANELSLDYQSSGAVLFTGANVLDIKLKNELNLDYRADGAVLFASASTLDMKLSSEVGFTYPKSYIKIQGAGIWTV